MAVLDAFHVVKLATTAVDEVRRRVQQQTCGHRDRKNDPLYRIGNILHAGQEHLTPRQRARLQAAFAADERHLDSSNSTAASPEASETATTTASACCSSAAAYACDPALKSEEPANQVGCVTVRG